MKINGIELKWLGHSGFLIKNSRVIYIDPYNIKEGLEKADIILLTHSHYDHCSLADLIKIAKEGTKIFAPVDCQSILSKLEIPMKIEIISPNQEIDLSDLRIITIPSYNIDKPFHQQNESWVGYVVKTQDIVIYHAGDTDLIPEMQKLTGHKQENKEFIALLPVGGKYTMSSEEAVEAAKTIKPTLAIPMHWGSIIGTDEDAKEFCEMCKEVGIHAEILEKE